MIAAAAEPGRLSRWAFARRTKEQRFVALLRTLCRIAIIMGHEFFQINLSLRASALTFSVALSIVPLAAMSTAVLKGLGSGDQMRIAAYRFIDQLDPGLEKEAQTAVSFAGHRAAAAEAGSKTVEPLPTLNRHLHNAVDIVFDYVDKTNFAALGAFGIAGLLIVVIMVLNSVEEAMNAIWHTEQGRSWFRKIMDYLALLVLLPISVNIALAGDAVLASPKIMGYLTTAVPSALSVQMLFKLLPFVFVTLSLMMMYLFFPNVRVKTAAAFCGALFGAVFWFIMQRIYVVLQVGVANYNAIYGSFATVPLFLIWIQFGWIFILLGAALAYAIQNHRHYRLPDSRESTAQQRLQQAFDVLLAVYGNFAVAGMTSAEQLSERGLTQNEAELFQTVSLLVNSGLLHKVEQDGCEGLVPSRPGEQMTAAQVVRLIFGHSQAADTAGGKLALQVIQAAEQAAASALFSPACFIGGTTCRDGNACG